ncbi:MAG: extracellular solute-binding protein [Phycisphaerales bacterium]|nr:extracellular solute-binding protein [Phycisphaerales bacterium]
MQNRLLSQLALIARWVLAGIAAGFVIWAFARVGARTVRDVLAGDTRTEITVMHWAGGGGQEEDRIVADLIADFEKKHPEIRVNRINPGDTNSYYNKLQTMFAAGKPPDVFYMGWERFPAFVSKELMLDLEPLIERDRGSSEALDLSAFYPITLDIFRFGPDGVGKGELYGIPKDFTTIGFYYNKSLFDQAGVPYPRDDWTWDDYIDACRKIGKLEGCWGSEFVSWPWIVRGYLLTEGVDICDDAFRSRATEPEVYGALQRFMDWRFDEDQTLTSGKSKVATGESVFLTGKVGMAGPFGRWVTPSYRKIEGFEWDFAPMPRGKARGNVIATVSWSIAKTSPHPEAAWELIKSLCSADGQARAARLGLAVPTIRAVAESDAFLDPTLPPANNRAFIDQVQYCNVMRWPTDSRFEQRLNNRLCEGALRVGEPPLKEAIAQMEAEWANDRESPLNRDDFPRVRWNLIIGVIATTLIIAGVIIAVMWRRRRPGRLAVSEELAGYALVSPWVIGFAIFMAFPIVLSLLLAFSKWSGLSTLDAARWVGLANLRELVFHDPKFWTSLRVTAWFAVFAVPGGQILALLAAMLLNNDVRFSGFFRSAWYLPSVVAGVGVAILWRWVFDGDFGLLNKVLLGPIMSLFHIKPPEWLDADADWFGPPAFAIMSFWSIGGVMVIYLAGLKGVPVDLYEAAAIDGATWSRRMRTITLPMLSPVIFFNFIMAIIASFQVFTQAYIMTGGGPGDTTRFYVIYLYNQAFEFHEMGYASAMAWLLMILILLLTLIVMRGSRRFVYYEALKA